MMDIFDQYSAYTDLEALRDFSSRPLRKSIRVNTLKSSVETCQSWAKEHGWKLEPIPWCKEGFWIDREDRSVALGKDLLHLLGHIYMQESASMLPVAFLDPAPGERILDLSAAPGSKTTQIAARMQGRGVIVANDMQEKRLHTLVDALHRLGVTNAIVTKRTGQWFGYHMTERFDRVLIDAPCTAQGTVRKDPTALTYSSEMNVKKMAKLQAELLEAAIHATKVGGRIVYSTCTLTPEENEQTIAHILNKFSDQVFILPIGNLSKEVQGLSQAVDDAHRVQKERDLPHEDVFRFWPQTYDTEGFFCAVLEKRAPTCDHARMEWIHRKERPLPRSRKKEIATFVEEHFGASLLHEDDEIVEENEHLFLVSEYASSLKLPLVNFAQGIPLGKRVRDVPVQFHHDFVTLRGGLATSSIHELSDVDLTKFLKGEDLPCAEDLHGQVMMRYRGIPVGLGKARSGQLKNNLPRWMVQMA